MLRYARDEMVSLIGLHRKVFFISREQNKKKKEV